MHLVGPYMTTTKYNSKRKVANTKKLRDAKAEHEAWLKKHGVDDASLAKKLPKDRKGNRASIHEIPDYSKNAPTVKLSNQVAGSGAKAEEKRYTGTLIKGIATMHKSNAVPIMNKQQAIEVSNMRRG
jgi:LPS sulfotransferase NodH